MYTHTTVTNYDYEACVSDLTQAIHFERVTRTVVMSASISTVRSACYMRILNCGKFVNLTPFWDYIQD